ncbi:MAG: GAF domain-containing protein [Phycisphaerae bacterium]|nr:GAF domain-containing protein [Phycisphaerae bacterium]
MRRAYEELVEKIEIHADRERLMRRFVDVLWDALCGTGVSWVGFYLHQGADELVLGPRRDKPACSPIGLHGACGRAITSGKPLVVRDVAELGKDYVACDPRDRSEVVIPLFDEHDKCWGVLDLDSHEPGAFDDEDVEGLLHLLRKAGLTR